MGVRPERSIRRYKLLPEASPDAEPRPPIRRYRLARVGVARRSALGADRHERLEEVVRLEENNDQQ
jgi:hypothetical protein